MDTTKSAAKRSATVFVFGLVPAAVVVAVLASVWGSSWLFLLDWAPGPRPSDYRINLPAGPLISLFHSMGSLGAAWSWLPFVAAIAVVGAGAAATAVFWDAGLRRTHPAGVAVAVAVAITNPFVASRLYVGQLGVLWGYASLWVVCAAVLWAYRRRGLASWAVPAAAWAFAATTTTQMVAIAAVPVVVGMMLRSRRISRDAARRWAVQVAGSAGAATLVWVVLAGPDIFDDAPAGGGTAAGLFASGGPIWTLPLRLAGGAGFWRPAPAGSLVVFGVVIAVAWAATLTTTRWGAGSSRDGRDMFLICAVTGVVMALAGRTTLASVWLRLVEDVGLLALFREPGKWTMLCMLWPALGAGAAVSRAFAGGVRGRWVRPVLAATVVVAVSAGAGLVWAGFINDTNLATANHPNSWAAAEEAAQQRTDSCVVAAVGSGAYTKTEFSNSRVVANPMPSYFGQGFIVSRDPGVAGLPARPARTAAERWLESANAAYMRNLAADHEPARVEAGQAAAAGVGWIMVDLLTASSALLDDLETGQFNNVLDLGDLGLWVVEGGCADTEGTS